MMNSIPTLDDYIWLAEGQGSSWLTRLAQEPASVTEWARRLRRDLSAWETHLVLTQSRLRRAERRFPDAAWMLFEETGLQQASDPLTAGYKASRFRSDDPVADLCCGLGGDLRELAQRGPAEGVDREPIQVYLAQHNLVAWRDATRRRSAGRGPPAATSPNLTSCRRWRFIWTRIDGQANDTPSRRLGMSRTRP